jgi:hypothetical protein
MRQFVYAAVVFLFLPRIYAQTKQDPFHGHYKLASSSEIALFLKNNISNQKLLKHQIFRYYSGSGKFYIDSATSGYYTGNLDPDFSNQQVPPYYFGAVSGDFTGTGLDNIVAAWVANDSSIKIVVPKINKNDLSWNHESILTIPYTELAQFNGVNNNPVRFNLIKGYFNSSPNAEFALAFWNKQDNVEIRIYNVDPNTLVPVQIADLVTDVNMDPAAQYPGQYGIAAGDFNGNGRDEIVLAASENSHIIAEVYEIVNNNGQYSIVPKAKNNNIREGFSPNRLDVICGDFKNNTLDQFIIDYTYYSLTFQYSDYLLPASVDTSLDSIKFDPGNIEQVFIMEVPGSYDISVTSGDLNNDGRDEILADGNNVTTVYSIDDTLHLHKEVSIPGNTNPIIADLDASTADSIWTPEIICKSGNGFGQFLSSNFRINIFEPILDKSGNISSVEQRTSILPDSGGSYYWAMTAGAYDGKDIRLGTPKYFSATNIIQPLVILNAPPTHYDVFNDTTFDINNMYNGNGTSEFFSQYYTQSQNEIQFESEIHSDWAVGATVSGGFKIPKVNVGVKIKLEGDYGKKFSKQTISSHTYTVSDNITSTLDDRIYATMVDYDIWEYPIIADDSTEGYTLTVVPGSVTKAWFPSKSPEANEYIPNHEVGNILSYAEIAQPSDNPALKTAVQWSASDAIVLDRSTGSSYDWSLESQSQTETQTTNEVDWRIGASASFDAPFKFIPSAELHGNYSNTSISTRTNKVIYTNGLSVHLGPVSPTLGEDYYRVTPYAYWSKSGSLVLDYAVEPDANGINQPETWWQLKYGHKSDPALILPWRLDNYKGANEQADQLQETKDIIFNPDNPKPGDTINIQARIHNFSLINTPGQVEAKFYMGDPSHGGTAIQSVDGTATFHTPDYIPARGNSIISFNWKLPADAPFYPRIYIVIDPNNKIDEIHKTNDIGWKVLSYSGGTTGIKNENITINNYQLSQNYPNPFNPTTTIEYTIPKSGFVSLKVYDILGREVKTLVHQQELPGIYKVQFNGSNLASGVYFYRIEAGEFVSSKKFVLLK